jgi:iron(III) transport system ATP-binding protein
MRGELRRDVRRALQLDGATAILVTHDQGEALSIADQVAVMRAGRIMQSGTPDSVYGAPVDLWVATFVGEAVLLQATVSGAGVSTVLGELAVAGEPGSGAVTAMLRPEQVDVLRNGASERAGVPATVTRTDFHGHDALISLRLADGTPVLARVLGPATDATVGAEVTVRVRGAARVFNAS